MGVNMMTVTNHLLNAALNYANRGYPVFPCRTGEKVPLTERGFHDATTDREQIERWWGEFPDANIGLPTQGLLVVDIDGTDDSWLNPERRVELSTGPTSMTPSGGRHHIFRQPEGRVWRNTVKMLAEHVDTRANGGYIVVPPSVLDGGRTYQWVRGLELDCPAENLPEPPDWLVDQLDEIAAGTSAPVSNRNEHVESNVIPQGQRNHTLARLGGAMRHVGMSLDEITAALLKANTNRCQPALDVREVHRIAMSIVRYEPDQISVALVENHWEQMYQEYTEPSPELTDPGPIPTELLRVPGFIEQVMAHTLETAPYPDRVLAFSGALALQALLAGRKVRDPLDNRTNLYMVALANPGTGKDHPRKVNQQILIEAGLGNCLGNSFASGEGIEDRLHLNPSTLYQVDEFDGLLLKVTQAKDGRNEPIVTTLLQMYSTANSAYVLRTKAGKEQQIIQQPNLVILGTAVPKPFYKALSPRLLTNGFLARFLILEAQTRGRGKMARSRPIPEEILTTARWWADFRPGGGGNLSNWNFDPQLAESNEQADEAFRAYQIRTEDVYDQAHERHDDIAMAIWSRAYEKARRLALIYACSANHTAPMIDEAAARWACEFADHQTCRMLFMANSQTSESDFDAKRKRLLELLSKWRDRHGDQWMPAWQISRSLSAWNTRDHEEVRKALVHQRLIEVETRQTRGRPGEVCRLIPTAA